MAEFKPPKPLSFDGDVAENWECWKQLFQYYIVAKELENKEDKLKIAVLMTSIGVDGVRRFNQFTWTGDQDKNNYEHVITKFDTELNGTKRVVFNRFKFWEYQRSESQVFDDYYDHVKFLANKCEFTEIENMIRDKLIFSTTTTSLKERLLRANNPDLKKVVEFSRADEITKREIKTMKETRSQAAMPTSSTACSQSTCAKGGHRGPIINSNKLVYHYNHVVAYHAL